jgi:hypothetical protein
MLNPFDSLFPALSVIFAVNETVPAVVGMPEITPFVERLKPAGKLPL